MSACTTDSDCVGSLPTTTPADCATASCDLLAGHCVFKAKDEDGDGHPAANCKAVGGSPTIVVGDDCNDADANLYPGHPESCTPMADGGGTVAGYCAPGQISCLGDGTISPCTDPLICYAQACVGGACQGMCAPGQTQCSGTGLLQTCQADGTWNTGVSCTASVCTQTASGASCTGTCSVGETKCAGNGLETCSNGTLGSPVPCMHSTCTTNSAGNGACTGTCTPTDTMACNTESTACNPSTVTCTNGTMPTCPAPIQPTVGGTSVGGSCTVGTGACARTGTVVCSGVSAVCNATAGTPDTSNTWHTIAASNGSFDWNCDGSIEYEYECTSGCGPYPSCSGGYTATACGSGQYQACGADVTPYSCRSLDQNSCNMYAIYPQVAQGCY